MLVLYQGESAWQNYELSQPSQSQYQHEQENGGEKE